MEDDKFKGYEVIRSIGNGSFGQVYLATDQNKNQVAIKQLKKKNENEQEKQKFIKASQEFVKVSKAVQGLDHPNIIRIIDVCEGQDAEKDSPYIVMPFMKGGNLDEFMRNHKLSLKEIVDFVDQLAPALDHAHKKNIVHGDIKPANILFDDNRNLVLCDFGYVIDDANNNVGFRFGTPAYMAPEQFDGVLSPECDQYALGIVVYELLCGERPFNGNNADVLKDQHKYGVASSLCEKNPQISRSIEGIIFQAMSKKPGSRYENVESFAKTLATTQSLAVPSSNSSGTTAQGLAVPSSNGSGYKITLADNTPQPGSKDKHLSRRRLLQFMVLAPAFLLPAVWVGVGTRLFTRLTSTLSKPTPPGPVVFPQKHTFLVYYGHTDNVNSVAWSLDGTRIASASFDGTAQVWDANIGEKVVTYTGHKNQAGAEVHVNDVAWAPPHGEYIASCSDQNQNQVHIWDASSGQQLVTILENGHSRSVNALKWSPDGRRLATASYDGTVRVWDWDGSNLKNPVILPNEPLITQMFDVSWSHDGNSLAFCSANSNSAFWIYTLDGSWKETFHYPPPAQNGNLPGILSIAWSYDDQLIVYGSDDNKAYVWDVSNQKIINTYRLHLTPVRRVAWSPMHVRNCTQVASSDRGGQVRLWDATTNACPLLYTEHADTSEVNALAWSPNGQRIASGGSDKTVRIWQAV